MKMIEILNYKIYSLICPITRKVRYIGYTKYTLEWRLSGHLKGNSNTYKIHWINALKKKGLIPIIKLIEENISNKQQAEIKEIMYIKFFKTLGARLVNNTIGGGGNNGYKFTKEAKLKCSIGTKLAWDNTSEDKKKEKNENIRKGGRKRWANMSENEKKEINRLTSEATKIAMANLGEEKNKERMAKRLITLKANIEKKKALLPPPRIKRKYNKTISKTGIWSEERKAKSAATRAATKERIRREIEIYKYFPIVK